VVAGTWWQTVVAGLRLTISAAEQWRHFSLVQLHKVQHEGGAILVSLRSTQLGQVGAHGALARAQVPCVLARRGGVREGEQRAVEQRGSAAERRHKVGRQISRQLGA